MIHVTCRLTAKNRDQLRNPTLGNRVWATCTLYLYDRVRNAWRYSYTTEARTYKNLSSAVEFEHDRDAISADRAVLIAQSDGTRVAGQQSAVLRLDTEQLVVHHLQLYRHTHTARTTSSCAMQPYLQSWHHVLPPANF